MRWKVVAPIAIVLAAAFGAAAYLAVYGVSLNRFKGDVATAVRDATGREFEIRGDLRLWLLWRSLTPKLVANQVAFANASWAATPTMIEVGRLEAEFDPLALLSGGVDIKRLAIVETDLVLETDRGGRGNWELGIDNDLATEGKEYALEDLPVIRLVEVVDLDATYRDERTGKTTTAMIDLLDATAGGVAQPIWVRLKARVNGEPVSASGAVGSLQELLDGRRFAIALSAAAAGATLAVDGEIGDLSRLSGIDLTAKASGPELADLGRMASSQLPPSGRFDVSGRLTGSAAVIGLQDLSARLKRGDLKLAASGNVGNLADLSGLDLKLSLSGSEFAALARLLDWEVPEQGRFEITGGIAGSGRAIVVKEFDARVESGDLRLGLDGKLVELGDSFDLSVKLSGEELARLGRLVGLPFPDMGAFDIEGRLAGSRKAVALREVTAILTGLTLTVDGKVGNAERFDDLDLRFALVGDDLAELEPIVGATLPRLGPLDFKGRFTRSGNTYAIDKLDAIVGRSDARGSVDVVLGDKPKLTLILTSGMVDVVPLLAGLGGAEDEATDGKELLSDEPLPFDVLHSIDADIRLDVERMVIGDAELRLNQAVAALSDGRLTIDPFEVEYRGGPISGALLIDAESRPKIALKILAQNFDLGRLLEEAKVTDLVKGEIDVGAGLRAQGGSSRAIAGSLDGTASFVMGRGEVASRYVDLIAADLLHLLMPWNKSIEETPIKCALGQFVINQGVVKTKALLLDTRRMIVAGKGTIDLPKEKIDLLLSPRPKDPSLFSLATDIRVGGTFEHTSVYPDPAHLLIEVAEGVAGELLLGPIGLLIPFASLGAGHNHPCVNDLQKVFGKMVAIELRHQAE